MILLGKTATTALKTTAIKSLMMLLMGCNGSLNLVQNEDEFPGYFPVNTAGYLFQGSAIQWNEHYAITAAHIPMLSDVVHTCSTGCDLVFIRHEAEGPVPKWRKPIAGEKVETVGRNPLLMMVEGDGTSKAFKTRLTRPNDNTIYSLTDAPLVVGMSGGPVYGSDKAVLGMNVGIFEPSTKLPAAMSPNGSLSVYVPYETIEREWRLLAAKQMIAPDTPVKIPRRPGQVNMFATNTNP